MAFGFGGSKSYSKPVVIPFTENELEAQGMNLEMMQIQLNSMFGAVSVNDMLQSFFGPILSQQASQMGASAENVDIAQNRLMEIISNTGITDDQRELLDRIEATEIDKIRSDTRDNLELLRTELAPSRGFRASDTPIVDRGQRIAEAGIEAESQVRAARSQAELQLPFQEIETTGSFLSELQNMNFMNQLRFGQQAVGSGLSLAGLGDIAAQSQALRPIVGQKSKGKSFNVAGGS
jgi:hypothetical protein